MPVEDEEELRKKLEKLPPFRRWNVEVSGFTDAYERAAHTVKEKLDKALKDSSRIETSYSELIRVENVNRIQEVYENLLRTSVQSGITVEQEIISPRRQYARLKAQLEEMRDSGTVSDAEFKTASNLLVKFRLSCMSLDYEIDRFRQTLRHVDTLSNRLLNRLREIRQTQSEKQISELNESLRKMTGRILLYTAVIAFFTVLTFIVAVLRG